jgi:hypothetical protein
MLLLIRFTYPKLLTLEGILHALLMMKGKRYFIISEASCTLLSHMAEWMPLNAVFVRETSAFRSAKPQRHLDPSERF